VSAASDILSNYQHVISDLRLVPGSGGVFEVDVDGESIFSKKSMGRHALSGEVLEAFSDLVGADVRRYGT
jgi:selenoprotein W-related protein